MILDVFCTKCGAVVKAEAPKFEMSRHGLPLITCIGNGMPGTPISLIHGSVASARVLVTLNKS